MRYKQVSEIRGFEQYKNYILGEDGTLINTKFKKKLYGGDNGGYIRYTLTNGMEQVVIAAHRLVAMAFKPTVNCENLEIDHIDRDTRNNHYLNLRWVDKKTNLANKRKAEYYKKYYVIAENINDGTTILFDTISDAAKQLNIKYSNIYQCRIGNIDIVNKTWRFYFTERKCA